jgi:hypothetical protein
MLRANPSPNTFLNPNSVEGLSTNFLNSGLITLVFFLFSAIADRNGIYGIDRCDRVIAASAVFVLVTNSIGISKDRIEIDQCVLL